jgi:hypothetical protein
VLVVPLVLVVDEHYLLEEQEQTDRQQVQEQMRGEIRVLVAVVVVEEELRDRYQ